MRGWGSSSLSRSLGGRARGAAQRERPVLTFACLLPFQAKESIGPPADKTAPGAGCVQQISRMRPLVGAKRMGPIASSVCEPLLTCVPHHSAADRTFLLGSKRMVSSGVARLASAYEHLLCHDEGSGCPPASPVCRARRMSLRQSNLQQREAARECLHAGQAALIIAHFVLHCGGHRSVCSLHPIQHRARFPRARFSCLPGPNISGPLFWLPPTRPYRRVGDDRLRGSLTFHKRLLVARSLSLVAISGPPR